jgi:monoamine oxidase
MREIARSPSGAANGGALFPPVTRRGFLERVGQIGGVTAVDAALGALGLSSPSASTPSFLPHGRAPRGTKVVVLGAGLSGLAAAYELQKLGYDVEVLEGRTRSGGRCHAIRRGTVSEETGRPAQTAAFDESLYLNAGPARIPHHHATTLEYCRQLGVAIEMFCSVNEAAYLHRAAATDPKSRRLQMREVRADWRGHTAEILAKAVTQDSLDRPMTAEDRDRMLDWLKREGGLGTDLRYAGTARRGYVAAPTAGEQPGHVADPLALVDLLHTGFGTHLATELVLQMPMFQAVGGMDRIAAALASRVSHVTLDAQVQAIEQPPGRVRVKYRDASGASRQTEGAYAICTLPLPVLRELSIDVAPAMRDAIAAINYASAGKIGLQFKRRFWEEDDGIYGGITKTDLPITQILYPSTGFLSRKGILVGYYQNGPTAAAMGELTPADRLARAMEQGAQIHPQYPQEFENAFSVAWQHVPHSRGGWAQYTEAQRRAEYRTLIEPDRALYLCGDHTTYLCGWMAGAFESARRVVSLVHERASREVGVQTAGAAR